MSTRYVWEKSTRSASVVRGYSSPHPGIGQHISGNSCTIYYSSNYDFDGETFSLRNPQTIGMGIGDGPWEPPANVYCMVNKSSFSADFSSIGVDYDVFYTYSDTVVTIEDGSVWFRPTNQYGISVTKNSQGYASAATSGAYPTDGVSGSYWYEYQGSDDIDARGCAIFSR